MAEKNHLAASNKPIKLVFCQRENTRAHPLYIIETSNARAAFKRFIKYWLKSGVSSARLQRVGASTRDNLAWGDGRLEAHMPTFMHLQNLYTSKQIKQKEHLGPGKHVLLSFQANKSSRSFWPQLLWVCGR